MPEEPSDITTAVSGNYPEYVIHVDDHGHETRRYLDAEGRMLPLPPPRRGGTPRDKTKAKAARKARRKNR